MYLGALKYVPNVCTSFTSIFYTCHMVSKEIVHSSIPKSREFFYVSHVTIRVTWYQKRYILQFPKVEKNKLRLFFFFICEISISMSPAVTP